MNYDKRCDRCGVDEWNEKPLMKFEGGKVPLSEL